MFVNTAPLFPQGLISQYHNQNYNFDINLLDDVEIGTEIDKIVTSQVLRQSNENILDTKSYLVDIKNFILESTKDYIYNQQKLPCKEFWISASWINFCSPQGFRELHNHTNSIFSGVYYLQAFDNQPGLTFKKDTKNYNPFISLYHSGSSLNAEEAIIKVVTNDLIIFPSYMIHGHTKNTTDETRISLAFNILLNQPEEEAPPGWYHIKFKK